MAAAEEEKSSVAGVVSVEEALVMSAAAMQMSTEPTAEREPWAPLFDCTEKLDTLFAKPTKFQTKCRMTPDETLKLLKIMGFQNPRETRGRFKYCDLHRFMVFLMAMAHYKSFGDLSEGTRPPRAPVTERCINPQTRRSRVECRLTRNKCRVLDTESHRNSQSKRQYAALRCAAPRCAAAR